MTRHRVVFLAIMRAVAEGELHGSRVEITAAFLAALYEYPDSPVSIVRCGERAVWRLDKGHCTFDAHPYMDAIVMEWNSGAE